MKKRTPVAIAVTGALIAGAAATGVIFHQHTQASAAYDEAHAKLAEKVETLRDARDTAATDLAEAQSVLDEASLPGALARTLVLIDLEAAVDQAAKQFAGYDELLAGPEELLAEADSDKPFWPGELEATAAAMFSKANRGSAAGVPELQLEAAALAKKELERTSDIVAVEEQIAATPAAQDASGSYRPAAEKLVADAGFNVRSTTADAAACGDLPIRGAAAAFVCPGTDDVWIVDGITPDTDPYLDAAIRHEIAHQMIFQRCGTADPPEAGDRFEAVTHSYAELYLGADRAQLDSTASADYAITPESDAAARQIHDAGCAA